MAGKGNPKTGGRKKGSVNRRTRYLSSVAAKAGLTPAEYLFGVLRDAGASVERRDWAAATLAPYVHPRLASVEQKVAATTEVRISRAQLNRFQCMLGGFAGATEEDLDLANVVMRDCEIWIESYCTFKCDKGLIKIFR